MQEGIPVNERGSSDEQLMAAVMAGDQGALAALVTRHHAPMLGYLYRLVGGERPLAEDLVQEDREWQGLARSQERNKFVAQG